MVTTVTSQQRSGNIPAYLFSHFMPCDHQTLKLHVLQRCVFLIYGSTCTGLCNVQFFPGPVKKLPLGMPHDSGWVMSGLRSDEVWIVVKGLASQCKLMSASQDKKEAKMGRVWPKNPSVFDVRGSCKAQHLVLWSFQGYSFSWTAVSHTSWNLVVIKTSLDHGLYKLYMTGNCIWLV